jgi:O-antigen ligase
MDVAGTRRNNWQRFILLLFTLFFASLFFSWRAITSCSIALLFFSGIFYRAATSVSLKFSNLHKLFLLGAITYILIIAFWVVKNKMPFFSLDIQLKSGILILPIAIILNVQLLQRKRSLLAIYCGLLCLAALYCLLIASWNSLDQHDPSFLFYHKLVSPFRQHAVYFSIYCLLGVFFLQQHWAGAPFNREKISSIALVLLSVFILLLSSKLVIIFLGFLWLQFIFSRLITPIRKWAALLSLVAFCAAILITNNPIGARFRDSISGDPFLAEKEKFDPGIYFNGAQFRILQWKLVPDILNKKDAWVWGVGPVNAQPFLNEEYLSRNMYAGNSNGDPGYMAYNCHDQLLESLLRYGIPGMLCYLFMFIILLIIAIRLRHFAGSLVIGLFLIYSLLESMWETQYGIMLFFGLPFFIELVVRANLKGKSND